MSLGKENIRFVSFSFLQSFLCVLLGVSGDGSVFSLASKDSGMGTTHRIQSVTSNTATTCMGCKPDFEEVGNKTRF